MKQRTLLSSKASSLKSSVKINESSDEFNLNDGQYFIFFVKGNLIRLTPTVVQSKIPVYQNRKGLETSFKSFSFLR